MRNFIIVLYAGLLILIMSGCGKTDKDKSTLLPDDVKIYTKVDSILGLMTLEEKVGQMLNIGLPAILEGPFYSYRDTLVFDSNKVRKLLIEYKAGSVQNLGNFPMTTKQWRSIIYYLQKVAREETRLGIPVLYGIDAVHGANYTKGSVMFPHQINIAATFDTRYAKKVGEVTAYELKSGAIPWNYAPVLDVSRHPMWGRLFESFGEDTYVVTKMGEAMLKGMQGIETDNYNKVIACPKHFIGYGASYNGKDRSPVILSERSIRQTLLPPFKVAVENGIYTVMVSSGALNGIPSHVDYNLITQVLKNELGFKGAVISDWNDIDNLHTVHKVAVDERDAVKQAVNAGIDICMEPYDESFAVHLIDLVKSGEVPVSRVNDAVRRILYVKYKAGVITDPLFDKYSYDKFASEQSDSLNHLIACESITLLKNENEILPLAKGKKILVTGVAANSINYLNGAWSRTWAGQDTSYNDPGKLTILEAVQQKAGRENVIYATGTGYTEEVDISEAVRKAKKADIIVACVGEKPATEKPGDIEEIDLPVVQQKLIAKLAETKKPVVLVMVQGRPRIIREIEPLASGIVMAYLPGNEGGRAIADVLFGDFNPGGKLPYTYPRYSGSLWTYDHLLSDERDVNFGLKGFTPQYEFGYGLSYTTFAYSDLQISSDSVSVDDTLRINVRITNSGKRKGKEVAMLFVSDETASVSPPVKLLKRFKKVELEPEGNKIVEFEITANDLKFVGINNNWIVEPGYFNLKTGTESTRFYLYK